MFCAQGGSILEKAQSGPAFKDKFKKRFNADPDAYGASYYDQTMLFIGEVDDARPTPSTQTRWAPSSTRAAYKGVAATYAYDDKGNMKQAPITVFTFKNAAPVPIASY